MQWQKNGLLSIQIAEATGRKVSAVARARYHWTGHFHEKGRQRETEPERLSKVAGECRVINMAKKLNVKLLDVL